VADQAKWPQTSEDVAVVRAQLERMLKDPLFNQSRRYPRLLHRIVEETLAGKTENLKERILGIELFDRAPDYDTNGDAIVRVTAAEIRKRIAQYYHEKDHRLEPRIDLPVGAYVAEFALPQAETEPPKAASVIEPPTLALEAGRADQTGQGAHRVRSRSLVFLAAGLALLVILGAGLRLWSNSKEERNAFWRPFTSNGPQPLLCVGQLPINAAPQGPQDSLARSLLSQRPVSISDAIVVSEYATYLGTKGIQPRIQVSTATTYTDLRQRPVLFIGGLDNNWTLRFLEGLRYRMSSDLTSSVLQIYDSSNPSGQKWQMDFAKPSGHVTEDYAIVARFYAPATENTVMIAAGLGENGTATAADFLLHSQYLKEIEQHSPAEWKNKNMELVLKTEIIDGNAGPPVIVARYFW